MSDNKTREVLISIPMENASEADLQQSIKDLQELAKKNGIDPMENYAWHSRFETTESDEVEDLANDFEDAGFEVDYDDGCCITIYEKVKP